MGGLPPGKTTTRSGEISILRVRETVSRDCLTQRQNALRIAIMRQVEIDLALDLLRDMSGQRKIRLAQIAFDDFVSLPFQLCDLRPDAKRVFAADAIGSFRKQPSRCGCGLRFRFESGGDWRVFENCTHESPTPFVVSALVAEAAKALHAPIGEKMGISCSRVCVSLQVTSV